MGLDPSMELDPSLVGRWKAGDTVAEKEVFDQLFRYYCIPRETRRREQKSLSAMMCEGLASLHYRSLYHVIANDAEDIGSEAFHTKAFPGYTKDMQTNKNFHYFGMGFKRYLEQAIDWKILEFLSLRKSQDNLAVQGSQVGNSQRPGPRVMAKEEIERLLRLLEKFPEEWLERLKLRNGSGLLDDLRREMDSDVIILLEFLYSRSDRDSVLVDTLCKKRNVSRGRLYTQISRLRNAWSAFESLDTLRGDISQRQSELQKFRDEYLSSNSALQQVWDCLVDRIRQFSHHGLAQHANYVMTSLPQIIDTKDDLFRAIQTLKEKWQESQGDV